MTGLLFVCFGIGAVVMAGALFPLATRLGSDATPPDLRVQRWIQRAFALFVRLGILLGAWELTHSGVERLRGGPNLVVANHPTLMDVVFLLSFMPQADCVVKRAAWRNPALRGIVRVAGYIPNDEGNALLEDCAERLGAGRSVVLFPEGSRSPERGLRRFLRGAAHVALRSGCDLLPVVIDCDPPALKKGQPWYRLANETLKYSLHVGKPVRAVELAGDDAPPPVAARRVNDWMRTYFESRLDHGVA